jgi:hypothetical protein
MTLPVQLTAHLIIVDSAKRERWAPSFQRVVCASVVSPGAAFGSHLHLCETPKTVAATDSDPVALQHFELVPEPVPAEVFGAESPEVWALRLSGGPVRDVLTTDPDDVATREYVFALPLDAMGNLARKLTEVYERQRGTTP